MRLLAVVPARAAGARPGSFLVVGDSDQSIYGWRGAKETLLRSQLLRDLGPSCLHLSLPSNYRSTPEVLAAADALLAASQTRSELRVRPMLPPGARVQLWTHDSHFTEAKEVGDEVKRLLSGAADAPAVVGHEVAILYRANWQSRGLESALIKRKLKYIIIGGLPFFGRQEIKDLMCFLRLVANPADAVAFNRVVNVPPRKIGLESVKALGAWAEGARGSRKAASAMLLEGTGDEPPAPFASAEESGLRKAQHSAFLAFRDLFVRWRALARTASVHELLTTIIRDVDYQTYLNNNLSDVNGERQRNVDELLNLAALPANAEADSEAEAAESSEPLAGTSGLRTFLERAALMGSQEMKEDNALGAVRLMTMHASKGLEFHSVFVVGLEQGIMPSAHAETKEALEEERRNLYVAMTRSKQRLYLSHAESRSMYGGELKPSLPSPFLDDIACSKPLRRVFVDGFGARTRASDDSEPPPSWKPRQQSELGARAPGAAARRVAVAPTAVRPPGLRAVATVAAARPPPSAVARLDDAAEMASALAAKRERAAAARRAK